MRLFAYIILLLIFSSCEKGTSYYIDSENGNDDNLGISDDAPWASLKNINSIHFNPGDHILLKSGTKYYGQLEPQGSGTQENPILISSYGSGSRPAIHGKGEALHTILLYNVENWTIKNLEISNFGLNTQPGRRGLIIRAHNYGECKNIMLDSLEIHHVNGSLVKKEGGGSAILWQNSGDSIPTRFVNLTIQNCHLHHCERNGINSKGNSSRDKWFPSLNVIIRNNILEYIPGDGIVPIGCDGALIEHNVMRDCPDILSHKEAAAGIWPWSSDNTLIQFNEVSGHKAKWDGQGFDSDYNCLGTIIQNNYSHDNYGGFLLICNDGGSLGKSWNKGTKNTIIRNNLSINDGIRPYPTQRAGWFSPTIHITGPVSNSLIHNNVIIIPNKNNPQIDKTIVEMDNWGKKWPEDTQFRNNVFYAYDKADFQWKEHVRTTYEDNLYYGRIKHLPRLENISEGDPLFKNLESRGEGIQIINDFIMSSSLDTSIGIQRKSIITFN